MSPSDAALVELGRRLLREGYRFVTPTPLTHRRVNCRPESRDGASVTDVFGWSRPFAAEAIGEDYVRLLDKSGHLHSAGSLLRSAVRFSSLGSQLFVHSAFPTDAPDSVFFGPDTYRFASALRSVLAECPSFDPQTIIDIGAGSGAGGLFVSTQRRAADHKILLTDINRLALRFCEVNAVLNGVSDVECRASDILRAVPERADLIIANPPYLVDTSERAYRHGGGEWGLEISCRIVTEALEHLTETGKLVLYTGSPIVGGVDMFRQAVEPILRSTFCTYSYREIDPDVFGEELEHGSYHTADRIAAVLLVAGAPSPQRP